MFQDAARTTVAGVGDPVGSWFDPDSGIGATQSGTARPVRAAAGLTFDGVNDFLDAAIGARPQPETLYLVLQMTGTGAGFETISDAVGDVNAGRIFVETPSGAPFLSAISGGSLANTTRPYGALVAVCAVFNGASSVLRVNTSDVSGDLGTSTSTGLRLGAYGTGAPGYFASMRVAMVLRYAAAHTASQRDAIIAWAAARHGVTL